MSTQYLRSTSLIVGSDTAFIDLSAMQFKFEVIRGDLQTPNTCTIRVYNLSKKTANTLKSGEFTAVILRAGYVDNYGIIFKGTIKYVFLGHESAVDSYVDIIAGDGDKPYNYAVVNRSLAAGSQGGDHVALAADAMKEYGVEFDTSTNQVINGNKLPRGKVFYGPARDVLRKTAFDYGMTWSIQDGELNMVLQTSYKPGEPIVLTSATGLVGFPEQTQNGIHVRCLLNPAVKINQRIKIDNASINRFRFSLSIQAAAANSLIPSLDHDGMYKVIFANHKGDTRGNDFYTDMICLAIDPTSAIPLSLVTTKFDAPNPEVGAVNVYKGSQ